MSVRYTFKDIRGGVYLIVKNITMENMKYIKGYEGLYGISKDGYVMNRHGKIMKVSVNNDGYYKIMLSKYNKPKNYLLHRLMAIAFIPNLDNKPEVNHKDGDKLNNSLDNLEWCTQLENIHHAYENGLHQTVKCRATTLDGIEIGTYGSMKELSEKLNINYNTLRSCVRNNCKTGKYIIQML